MAWTRRAFVGALGAAAVSLRPILPIRPARATEAPQGRGDPGDEEFWIEIRSRFPISRERGIYLNTGTLGLTPYPVLEAIVDHLRATAAAFRATEYSLHRLKETAASFLGAAAHEIVITRNATEAMNFVTNGLELEPGDEILTSDHEHIGGLSCWHSSRGVDA